MSHPMLSAMMDHLAPVHAALGLAPEPDPIVQLLQVWDKVPEWVTQGYMPPLDAVVVHEAARAAARGPALEIGTASGVSVCALVLGLEASGVPTRDPDRPAVHTYDAMEHCYFDATRPVGSAYPQMLPDRSHAVRIHAGESSVDASRAFEPGSVPLAVIDGDHRHPFPLIDLVLVAPLLEPGAWIVLHDIHLPDFEYPPLPGTTEPVRYHHTGAQLLFERWPGEKVEPAPGAYVNIGLIRVPEEPFDVRAFADELLTVPFDDGVTPEQTAWWLEQSRLRVPTPVRAAS